jgi:DNA polymerase-3 subunit gamma/tau
VSYLVLARNVTRTLTHSIEQDRVHHAFLFCGARGVGKTSAARILARALNCESGPSANSCGTCPPCVEIASGSALDVFEIDGASNRGIGEIRELRDRVAYAPQRDRYKIYIIDEVHMLTTEAFNALLKTLEEPPAHVKFIFATTEPHKIPVTILSRCQRFDFKRIPIEAMTVRLSEILAAEGVDFAPGALKLVARESEGSMRDALSLLDRIIGFAGDTVTLDQVAEILGVADRAWLERLVASALAGDAPTALSVIAEVFEYGIDLQQFASDLVHCIRDIIVLRVAGDQAGLTDLSDEETNALGRVGHDRPVEDLERLFHQVSRTAERMAHASFPRLEMEMAAIRMCRLRPLRSLDQIVERLSALERHLDRGTPLPPPPPTPTGGSTQPVSERGPDPPAPTTMEPPAPSTHRAPNLVLVETPPVVTAPAEPVEIPSPVVEEEAPALEAPALEAPALEAPALEAPALEAPALEAPALIEALPVAEPLDAPVQAVSQGVTPIEELSTPSVEQVSGDSIAPSEHGGAILRLDQGAWEAFVEEIRADSPPLAASLDHSQVVRCDRGVLTLGFRMSALTATQVEDARRQVLERLRERIGPFEGLELETLEQIEHSPFQRREIRTAEEEALRRDQITNHPAVQALVTRFDGEIRRVMTEREAGGTS